MHGRAAGSALALLLLLAAGVGAQEEKAPGGRRTGPVTSSPYRILRIHVPESAGGLRVAASQGSAVANFGSREAVQPGSVFRVYDQGLSVGLVRVERVWSDSSRVRLITLDRKLDPEAAYPLEPGYYLVPELVLLETVRFDSTGLHLPLDMQERLRTAVRFIHAFPEFPVFLEAHADAPLKKKAAPRGRKGSAPEAPRLPLARAEELRTHLHEVYRIPLEQLHAVDLGSSQPLGNSATAAGRRQNLRIEVVVRNQAQAPGSTAPQVPLEGTIERHSR